MPSTFEVRIFPDANQLARAAAAEFTQLAKASVREKDLFTVVLSGGSTPKTLYSTLSDEPFRSELPWDRIHFFWGDERPVPPDHPESNFHMAHEALLSKIPVPAENVHRITGEAPDAAAAAQEYEEELRNFFQLGQQRTPRFDLVLLGLGSDGHTASLFPDTRALHEHERLVIANWVEKLNSWRITLTFPVLNNAAKVIFLVSGPEKAAIIRSILKGEGEYPARLVQPSNGSLLWLLDREAASELESTATL
jgi:6-phosphogluconolactonase